MRKLPGDATEAYGFDWDRFLDEGGGEDALWDLRVEETKSQHREPRSWWKAPRLSHWRFPPS